MGIRLQYIDYIHKACNFISGNRMLELGNQVMRGKNRPPEKTGKRFFTNRGFEHTSIDINGKHGAVVLDLSKPIIKPEWNGYFDIITNLGTTEHIEPFEGQYECFKNLHNFLSEGGVLVNIVPDAERSFKHNFFRKRHCNNYYKRDFFKMIAEVNSYELINLSVRNIYQYSCLIKKVDQSFMEDSDLFLSGIYRREDGLIYDENGVYGKTIGDNPVL